MGRHIKGLTSKRAERIIEAKRIIQSVLLLLVTLTVVVTACVPRQRHITFDQVYEQYRKGYCDGWRDAFHSLQTTQPGCIP